MLATYVRLLTHRKSPLAFTRQYRQKRGMDFWRDVEDWLGGLLYEYCRPEHVLDFLSERGFSLQRLKTAGWGRCERSRTPFFLRTSCVRCRVYVR